MENFSVLSRVREDKLYIPFFSVVFVAFCWIGVFDTLALSNINNSIKDAAILYGVARALNSAISVLQSLEVSIVVANVAIGEVLDPFNDLIERFSEVMTYALASLALQKILSVIVSNNIFNVLVTLSFISFCFCFFYAKEFALKIFRVFLVLSFIRFSFAMVVILSIFIDATLIKDQEREYAENISSLKEQVSSDVSSLQNNEAELEKAFQDMKYSISIISEQTDMKTSEISAKRNELFSLEQRMEEVTASDGMLDRINPLKKMSHDEELLREKINKINNDMALLENDFSNLEDQKERQLEKLECIQERKDGGTCSLGEWIAQKTDVANIKGKVDSTLSAIENGLESFIYLISIMILKSILLPIMFWFMIMYIIKRIWILEFNVAK